MNWMAAVQEEEVEEEEEIKGGTRVRGDAEKYFYWFL
jgi:hypothetical protein